MFRRFKMVYAVSNCSVRRKHVAERVGQLGLFCLHSQEKEKKWRGNIFFFVFCNVFFFCETAKSLVKDVLQLKEPLCVDAQNNETAFDREI
jgi:hypothetical protein